MTLSGISNSKLLENLSKLGLDISNVSAETGQSDETINMVTDEESAKNYEEIESDYAEAAAAISEDDEEQQSTSSSSLLSSIGSIMTTAIVDISTLPEEIQEYIEELQGKLDDNNSQISKLKDTVEKLSGEIEKLIQDAIKEYKDIQEEYDEESQEAVQEALNKYIAAKEADPENVEQSYLQKLIKDLMPNKPDLAEIVAEMAEASDLADEIDTCLEDINKLTQDSKLLESQISSLTTKQVTDCDKVASILEEEGITISDEEWELVEENDINLAETMEDGSSRYIFAQGQQDGEYHIYDMANGGASLARQYGCSNGYDIIESGNGYLKNYSETDESCGNTVYSINECGELCETQACYSTCSPLSFDLNGDGVKTSDSIIDYDIDGDGEMDKINDSADAVLVFDKDGDGISGADGSECFGNNTDLDGDGEIDGYSDGFEALKALASQEGLINGTDDTILDENDLEILEEKYGLKMKTDGYNSAAQSLSDLGITEINLAETNSTTLADNFDGNGNQLMQQEGATFTVNGETHEYADIWHKKQDETNFETSENEGFSYSTESQINELFYNFYTNHSESLKNKIENTKNTSINKTNTDKLLEQEASKESINLFGLLKLREKNKEIA